MKSTRVTVYCKGCGHVMTDIEFYWHMCQGRDSIHLPKGAKKDHGNMDQCICEDCTLKGAKK